MVCPECSSENPDSARFCGECGRSLSATAPCPECGVENPREQKFCNGCGHPLAAERPAAPPAPSAYTPDHIAQKIASAAVALEGERKQVTVLFCDVQGSMELADSVGAETWRSLMDRFYALVGQCVHRFEGTVNKFTGDGAMALFGAPIAHEDHARRACYAALHLRDELAGYARGVRREHGLALAVRMGLNSGEVVVGRIGDDLDVDYTAIGNTVGLAARMEALAEPDKPYLTRSTAALIEGYFELDLVGQLQVKGLREPVEAYALVGVGSARTRLDVSAGRGLSRFVGRAAELDALEGAYERSRGGGQVVGVVAEPGIGKSRLCREFVDRCRLRGIEVTEGRGVAHGRRIPLMPVVEMLRSYFGIGEDDDARHAREKIAGRLLLIDESFRDALPVLFDFLAIADPERPAPQLGPEARERILFGAISRLVHARAEAGGGVILVEDLHWLDPGSEAFLGNLIESLPGTRTLVVVNFRPEYRADWMRKLYYQQLPLLPLSREATAALVEDLIGGDPSLDGIGELVADRTGGNPFFIEEVIQSLVDGGALAGTKHAYRLAHSIDEIEIPPTVQAVLAARIDRLDERDKSVLQAAAVIGREFSQAVLEKATGLPTHELFESLGTLCSAELVFERTLYPEALYSFKHPLTEEVAYKSQLGERRARTHAAVAKAIEELEPAERLDELAGLLANHWEQAREPVKAAQWGTRAAGWAGQNHPADALRHMRRVRALAKTAGGAPEADGLAAGACVWILQFGWRQGLGDSEVEDVFAELLAIADRGENDWIRAAAYGAHAVARGMVGDVRGAYADALEGRRLAREVGALDLEMVVGDEYWLALLGETRAAIEGVEEAIELMGDDYQMGREVIGFSPLIWSIYFRANQLGDNGRLEEARRENERALALAREHDDVETLGWTHGQYGFYAWDSGNTADALAHARKSLEIADRTGSSFSRLTGYTSVALVHLAQREWAEAVEMFDEGLQLLLETRTGMQYESLILGGIAEGRLGMGETESAYDIASRGAELAEQRGMRGIESYCRLIAGGALAASKPTEARAELEHALELADDDFVAMRPKVHEALAELAGLHGRPDARERQLRTALELYREIGADGHARRVEAALADAPQPTTLE